MLCVRWSCIPKCQNDGERKKKQQTHTQRSSTGFSWLLEWMKKERKETAQKAIVAWPRPWPRCIVMRTKPTAIQNKQTDRVHVCKLIDWLNGWLSAVGITIDSSPSANWRSMDYITYAVLYARRAFTWLRLNVMQNETANHCERKSA